MKAITSLICLTIACFFGPFCSVAARAAAEASPGGRSNAVIQVQGEVVWQGLVKGQSSGSNKVTRFSVVLGGCKYRMDETGHPTAHPQSFYCDGTNWYSELVPPNNFMASNITRMTAAGPVTIPLDKPIKTMPSLTVSPIIEPLLPRITSLLPVWLAFGGGCHFDRENAQEIPSMFVMVPGPLSQVAFLKADRVLRTDGGLERYTDYWGAHLFTPQQRTAAGLTNIAFRVTAWTNIGAMNIPAAFRFVRYYFAPDQKPEYYRSMDGAGKVTKVERLGGTVAFRPTIAMNTHVVHFSSHSWEPVTYSANDARLKTQDEVDSMRR